MLAFAEYRDSLCPGCRHEKAKAWHPDNDGWLEVTDRIVCHGCTAQKRAEQEDSSEPVKPVEFLVIEDVRDYEAKPLPAIPERRSR